MNNQDWNAISDVGIDNVMLDIIEYATDINRILNNISDLISDTDKFFNCESGEEFRSKFEELKNDFPMMNENILSYNTDLLSVKVDYAKRVQQSVEILQDQQQQYNQN